MCIYTLSSHPFCRAHRRTRPGSLSGQTRAGIPGSSPQRCDRESNVGLALHHLHPYHGWQAQGTPKSAHARTAATLPAKKTARRARRMVAPGMHGHRRRCFFGIYHQCSPSIWTWLMPIPSTIPGTPVAGAALGCPLGARARGSGVQDRSRRRVAWEVGEA